MSAKVLRGHAALFDTEALIYEDGHLFVERIAPGAFGSAIAQRRTLALVGHNHAGLPLGRQNSGTLELREDARGLAFELELTEVGQGAEVAELARRGDLGGVSFAFTIDLDGDSWYLDTNKGQHVRIVERVKSLPEISLVAFPAYAETVDTLSLVGGERCLDAVEADLLARRLPHSAFTIDQTVRQQRGWRPEPAPFKVRGINQREYPLTVCELREA
jgi:HK97 family phage prohead protease